ncbi:hypothetical protein ACTXT7_003866 [Hymenolepis weldensis]
MKNLQQDFPYEEQDDERQQILTHLRYKIAITLLKTAILVTASVLAILPEPNIMQMNYKPLMTIINFN